MPLKHVSEQQIVASITENAIAYWKSITSESGQPSNLFNGEVEYVLSGMPVMSLNPLFDGNFSDPEKSIPKVVSYYRENRIPFMWYLSPDGKEKGYDKILLDLGIELAKMQVPGMAANLTEIDVEHLNKYAKKEELEIHKLDLSLNSKNTEIIINAFNMVGPIQAPYEALMATGVKDPKGSTYLASYGGNIGSTSKVYYTDDVAGIYDVATLHEMRGHGLGSAVVAQCMIEAKEKGYEIIILQSTQLGHPIYVKLGFKDYFVYDRFLLRPEELGY